MVNIGFNMGMYTVNVELELDQDMIDFIEQITGLKGQDAIEHFTVTCLCSGANPKVMLSNISNSPKF